MFVDRYENWLITDLIRTIFGYQTNPRNNMNIQITPKMKFYILESQYEPGVIVDYKSVSSTAANIDFSSGPGSGNTYAVVTQGNNGRFTVEYHPRFFA
jgi:hypothetical protein